MHEWALAESVVKTVELKDELKDKRVKILLGKLQSIDREVFNFALTEIMKQRNFKFDYIVEDVDVLFECRSCQAKFSLSDTGLDDEKEKENIHFVPEMIKVFVKCPKCGSIDFDIVEGRGVALVLDDNSKIS